MLIKCPECGKDVSSSSETCIHCGFPIKEYINELPQDMDMESAIFQSECKRLVDKVKKIEFICPPPRAKVCAKCGMCVDTCTDKPLCRCNKPYPLIEVDYPAAGIGSNNGVFMYVYENCVEPQNIGDQESAEYKDSHDPLYDTVENMKRRGRYILPIPPNEKWFGVEPTRETELSAMNEYLKIQSNPPTISLSPKCPICGSTNLSKITATKKAAKIFAFGIFGMGDNGKTWKCNNCGSKF